MKKLLLYLLLLPALTFGQISKKQMFFALANSSAPHTIVPLPSEPDFGVNPVANLTDAVGASVSQTALNTASGSSGTRHATIEEAFDQRLQSLQLVGTNAARYYWKSLGPNRSWAGGAVITTGQKVNTQTGGTISDFHEWNGIGVKGDPDPAVTGVIGISWTARVTTGSSAAWINTVVTDVSSAGIQINDGVTANTYDSLRFEFVRVIGRVSGTDHYGTEGFYIGNTNTTVYSQVNNSKFRHLFIANRGWDGFQLNSNANFTASNITVYNAGTLGVVGQRNSLQLQNVKGTLTNSIFYGAPDAGVIAANGLHLTDVIFVSENPLLWQDLSADAGYGASPLRDGAANSCTRCTFIVTGAATEAIDFREAYANMTFTDCQTNKATLIDDNRVSPTNSITQNGTVTGIAVPSAPTFSSLDPTDEDHGIVNETYWRNWGGYRIIQN